MGESRVEPKAVVGLGVLLMLLTLVPGWAPQGPWGQESFSRGVVGLVGALLLYIGWYRVTFGVWGLIPALVMWSEPKRSIRVLTGFGIAMVIASRLTGQLGFVPAPTGLLLMLFGLLSLLMAAYAWLVLEGPLADSEEE
ncbi:MAG TPA: hypothetical protein EYQ80_00090 [Candidatus Poseidoniales archaeon]|nr:hypothetical protein [Candidatus Poseidoniales archaeon]